MPEDKPTEAFEDLWRRLKPVTEGATPKEIGELFYQQGLRQGKDSEMRSAYPISEVSSTGARAI